MAVIARLISTCSAWLPRCARALAGKWREPPPQLRPAARVLDVPLTSAPVVGLAVRLLLIAQAVYATELLLLGHPLVASTTLALAAALWWLRLWATRSPRHHPRRLLIASDGRLHILTLGGALAEVSLDPASMRLGPWLLLVLRGEGRALRLLIGPDNLDPTQLAALRWRLAALRQPEPMPF
jgi:hypothetical protein